MKVRLSPSRWKSLKCDQFYEIVRCAFYLGYSEIAISEFIRVPDSYESQELRLVAAEMGISDDDQVVLDVKVMP